MTNYTLPAGVLVHTDRGPASEADLTVLWDEIMRRGWLDFTHGPVIVRPGCRWFSPLVEQTALSLVEYLNQRAPQAEVLYIDVASAQKAALSVLPDRGKMQGRDELDLRVLGCCLQDGVPLAEAWLSPFSLVTVSGAGPDSFLGFSSVLRAQAEMIALPPNRARALQLECIYEAHRLVRSDMAVVCGPVSRRNAQPGVFWAVSNSDVAPEAAVAQAAGLVAERLPHLRYLARHEVIEWDGAPAGGDLPRLTGYAAPVLIVWCTGAAWALIRSLVMLSDNVRRVRKNLYRIAPAIRKRLARKARV